MNTFYIQYHARTLASLENRKDQQKTQHGAWVFDFPKESVSVIISDSLQLIDNFRLHTGLNLTVKVNGDSLDSAISLSKSYAEMLLNLISFVTQISCEESSIVSTIEVTKQGDFPANLGASLADGTKIIEPPKVISQKMLEEIFTSFSNVTPSEGPRVATSLSWLRKGNIEPNTIDKFLSYWFGIEVIACLLRDRLRLKIKNPGDWEGVKHILANKLGFQYFNKIELARNGLVHGYKIIDAPFINELGSYLEVMRKCLIYAIVNILNLDPNYYDAIADKLPIKTPLISILKVIGNIKNMPNTLEAFIEKYPSIQGTSDLHLSMNDKGDTDVTLKTNFTFILTKGVIFEANGTEWWRN